MSGYQDRSHLRDDVEAAKHAAFVVFHEGVVARRPHPQAALDALGAVWAWLDTIERDAGALVQAEGGDQ